jgi:predicted glycoside hydrolase/deacetylase ChbG (UPF0249 family)
MIYFRETQMTMKIQTSTPLSKKLIINADDCGADEARNAGIFEAIKKGVVTSVSILPNGPAFNDAIQRIKSLNNEKVSWGIHINLSEGKPLSSGLHILTVPDGCFPGKLPAIQLLTGNSSTALEKEIAIEVENQIRMMLDAGIPIHHLDSHHHIHAFPAVIKAVVRAAIKYKIPWIRIPEETKPSYSNLDISEEIAAEAGLFSKYAAEARTRIETTGIRTTDHFRGLYLKGRLSPLIMEELLLTLPDGLTEFMTHPGYTDTGRSSEPFSTFSTHDRERELETLLHPDFFSLLEKHHVSLTSFT